jgi:hypothetical protein
MRKLAYAALAALLSIGAAGCQNALADDAPGPMTGTWRFTLDGYRAVPRDPVRTCSVTRTVVLRQDGQYLQGNSPATTATCTLQDGTTESFSWNPAVVSGEVENGRVNIFTDLVVQCFAELHPTRLEGYVESYSKYVGEGFDPIRQGTCTLEKISDDTFEGY